MRTMVNCMLCWQHSDGDEVGRREHGILGLRSEQDEVGPREMTVSEPRVIPATQEARQG